MVSDFELIRRVRLGDVDSYGALVERHELAVFATVLSLVRNRHTAEDVTQEAFVQAYVKLGSLSDGSRFGVWVLRIARRIACRSWQRARRRNLIVPPDGLSAAACADSEYLSEEKEHLLWHVQKLPIREQATVALRFFGGHTAQEIAEMDGGTVGSVTKRLTRAIGRLRRSMAKENRQCARLTKSPSP